MNLRRYHKLAHFQTLTSKPQIYYYIIQLGRLSKSLSLMPLKTMSPILQILKDSLDKHLYVLLGQASKETGQLHFQSLNRVCSPDGPLNLC